MTDIDVSTLLISPQRQTEAELRQLEVLRQAQLAETQAQHTARVSDLAEYRERERVIQQAIHERWGEDTSALEAAYLEMLPRLLLLPGIVETLAQREQALIKQDAVIRKSMSNYYREHRSAEIRRKGLEQAQAQQQAEIEAQRRRFDNMPYEKKARIAEQRIQQRSSQENREARQRERAEQIEQEAQEETARQSRVREWLGGVLGD